MEASVPTAQSDDQVQNYDDLVVNYDDVANMCCHQFIKLLDLELRMLKILIHVENKTLPDDFLDLVMSNMMQENGSCSQPSLALMSGNHTHEHKLEYLSHLANGMRRKIILQKAKIVKRIDNILILARSDNEELVKQYLS